MGRDVGEMTPKAVAKRIKAKGLQKLRWYCQMCEKQCRDENGFKCHCESLSHQRKLELFAQNPNSFIDSFSRKFQAGFLDILRNRFGTSLVKANTVYQEYIKDKHHVHMNATKWVTLSEFVKYLGREGICRVQEKEGVWRISYVDREVAERSRRARELERQRLEEEERADKILQRRMQIIAAREESEVTQSGRDSVVRYVGDPSQDRMDLELSSQKQAQFADEKPAEDVKSFFESAEMDGTDKDTIALHKRPAGLDAPTPKAKKRSRWTMAKENPNPLQDASSEYREDYWIVKNLVVKILSKTVGNGEFYKKKGVITAVEDEYTALVKMKDSGAILRIDQDDLETVIPKPGKNVMIVNGRYRGKEGQVRSIDFQNYVLKVRLDSGKDVDKLEYEDVCKYDPAAT